jgi:hypothetical protein
VLLLFCKLICQLPEIDPDEEEELLLLLPLPHPFSNNGNAKINA